MTAKKSASVKKPKAKKKATAKKATAKKATAPKAKAKAKAKKPVATKKTAVTKKTAATRTKKTAAKPRPAPKKKAAAAPKKKPLAAKKRTSRPRSKVPSVPPARPSDRAMAIVAQLPQERALTDEEREAMAKCAQTALAALSTDAGDGVPEAIVSCIGGFVDDIRMGRRPEPSSQDIRLGLGVLWGEQVRAQVGWRWVHLSYPNGFASYAVVPDDRAFACFPLNRLTDLMRSGADVMNTSVPLFDSICIGALPARRENAYLVIG